MTTASDMKDRYVLVTGGSSGIGAAIADEFASRGANLVLVARDAGQLERTAADLRERHGVTVLSVALALDRPGAPRHLMEILREAGVEVEVLVNNAAVGARAMVADSDPTRLRQLVDLNVGALTELTTLLVAGMVHRGHGSVVNIASTGAYTPAPVMAAYAASKAYVLSFTRALWAETRASGVRVVAVSPGQTQTPMNPRPGRDKRQPAQVARTVLAALEGTGPAVVDGGRNKVATVLMCMVPARLMATLALRMMARGGAAATASRH
ncbi:SDR family NAD(P)-dependent oxidoreductase [Micromonospora sp. WMMD714]|uniref:SDR family NAD(P)-dependent oxidoreductase n=1 Tax=Micromonospora sp. WMMD714 TaxID=3016097 RepID=UPI00249C8830|nr:SDR family NAD(P)-dependent oxidoreductase [Micromonospora sp. WMMD714]WFE65056.1 SDR family NAD(P)-dependent oxidoreductase [Micromonospora sp. WMMD714]